MAKLGSVIIGCGAMAREHLATLVELDNVEVLAVCDVSAVRAEAMADRFGIPKWYLDYEQLIRDFRPDLVHITTPPKSHFEIAKGCLSAGVNVLCEKPISLDYSEFRLLRQMAESRHCILMENHNYKFHSSIRRLRDLLTRGELGDIVDVQIFLSLDLYAPNTPYLDHHYADSLRGGVIGDFLTHMAYLAQIFIGASGEVRTIWKKHQKHSPLFADEFRALVQGELAPAYLAFSSNAQPDGFWVRITCTRAHAEANLFEPPRVTFRRRRPGEPAVAKLLDGIAEAQEVFSGTVGGFWRKLGGISSYDGLRDMLVESYRALQTNTVPPVSIQEVDDTVRLVDQLSTNEFKL